MGRKLYVGNLHPEVTPADLEGLFAPYGTVRGAQVAADPSTGRSRGFGHVEMGDEQQAHAAAEALNGQQWSGHVLAVREDNPDEHRGPAPGAFGDRGGAWGGRD